MHYVDKGSGHPVLMVHGTPTWSFLYRDLVESVAQDHRAIAIDHLGFGLSAKPEDGGYRPADHAQRLTAFIDELGVEQFTLVVHDFGGPIGLSYAVQRPAQIDRLVLFNTWLWSLKNSLTARLVSLLMRGVVGRLFYRRYNGSPRLLLKAAWGDETPLSDDVHRHYRDPFPTAADRTAPLVLARELIGSTDWYRSLWEQRSNIIDKPTLLMWGLQDPTFGESVLERWEDSLSAPQVHRLPAVGHFVPDEAADTVIPKLIEFIDES
jgi:haloalkane dehalogenase